ncbi:class IV adenylate cyclase [Candidatus Uhrbacteria bacterium CG_4_9_14_3_um_filter_41_35]|uniref:Class IV adenylate cyclase n=1 Tax=Candidatus Uhrbacteria bacterium CG_4_9_14_3_um_filter_41_35 TaxID=1975034 RepID=A0A2M7XFE5_9BACT|nr:MAG: class IV adenylate cyclase [Candidatus Uhrbacteria bacterium CG11_big_fil_rev_8_21_14_0_20_41_9]PJA46593.1 MAG: class IV adenylate cyclase [Candidatus Uhrbacteria bacterium CG_4_9_14_3_um_filter_41_35]
MKEIEVKILEVDEKIIVKQLLDLGAEKIFDGEMDVIYYDYPDEYFRARDKRIRLRKKGDKAEMTYKEKISRGITKIEEEHEIKINDFEIARQILLGMEMVEIRRYQKDRRSYKLGNMYFEFDFLWEGVPVFMEIEGPTEELVMEWVEKLGFKKEDAKNWSGSEVLEHYGIAQVKKLI